MLLEPPVELTAVSPGGGSVVLDGEVVDDADLKSQSRGDAIEKLQRGQEPFSTRSASANAIMVSVAQKSMELPLRV